MLLDRATRLKILVESNRKSVQDIDFALESLETGTGQRTSYSTLQRSFHTIKHDAAAVQLTLLAKLAAAAETVVARAREQRLGLPVDLLQAASREIRTATETIAAGGRHKLDAKLLKALQGAAESGGAEPGPRSSP